jgi:hypothetical protein
MVPKMAALDPDPDDGFATRHITAATGIDALDACDRSPLSGIGRHAYSDGMALSAVGLIFENLRTAYTDGKNLEGARKNVAGLHVCRVCLHACQRGLRACHCPPVWRAVPHATRAGQCHHASVCAEATPTPPSLTDSHNWPWQPGWANASDVRRCAGPEVPGRGRAAQPAIWVSPPQLAALKESDIPATRQSGMPGSPHRLPGPTLHVAGSLRRFDSPAIATRAGPPHRRPCKLPVPNAAPKKTP